MNTHDKPSATTVAPQGRSVLRSPFSVLRGRGRAALALAAAIALCAWLRADTKPEEPDPTETQMMAVDGTLETLYPELPKVGLMAKSLRLATEDLQETELTVDELIDLVEAYTNAVHQIEIELDIETQADEGGLQE